MEKQRMIKFRYFDKLVNQFIYSDEFDWPTNYEKLEYFFQKAKLYCLDDKVQQFTDLLDGNGEVIYEGDIISFTQCLFNTKFENFLTKTKEVKWLKEQGKWNVYETAAGEMNVEVIGNIFENPELLLNK